MSCTEESEVELPENESILSPTVSVIECSTSAPTLVIETPPLLRRCSRSQSDILLLRCQTAERDSSSSVRAHDSGSDVLVKKKYSRNVCSTLSGLKSEKKRSSKTCHVSSDKRCPRNNCPPNTTLRVKVEDCSRAGASGCKAPVTKRLSFTTSARYARRSKVEDRARADTCGSAAAADKTCVKPDCPSRQRVRLGDCFRACASGSGTSLDKMCAKPDCPSRQRVKVECSPRARVSGSGTSLDRRCERLDCPSRQRVKVEGGVRARASGSSISLDRRCGRLDCPSRQRVKVEGSPRAHASGSGTSLGRRYPPRHDCLGRQHSKEDGIRARASGSGTSLDKRCERLDCPSRQRVKVEGSVRARASGSSISLGRRCDRPDCPTRQRLELEDSIRAALGSGAQADKTCAKPDCPTRQRLKLEESRRARASGSSTSLDKTCAKPDCATRQRLKLEESIRAEARGSCAQAAKTCAKPDCPTRQRLMLEDIFKAASGSGSSVDKTCAKPDCPTRQRVKLEESRGARANGSSTSLDKTCAKPDCPTRQRLKLEESLRADASAGSAAEKKTAKCKCSEAKKTRDRNIKESPSASSLAGSGAGSRAGSGQCSAVTRALHYHNKLVATLEILENKEETIRVQAESLRVAEARIAALTARAAELREELQRKASELRLLQARENEKGSNTNVSITADLKEHHRMVGTLQSNLSVIEELYRECFYEAAKQEKLIEMLRSDILDVRLVDKEKDTQIQKLQNVVHTQKWSLERCQDIAMEVDNLKMEISNFLNNSNHDSGMWERDPSPSQGDAMEDLREISAQLLQLRDMLTTDCTCGLKRDNKRLKQENEKMEMQIAGLEQRVKDTEAELAEKACMEQQHAVEIEERDEQISSLTQQLNCCQQCSKDVVAERDQATRQLQQTEVLLSDKCEELATVQHQLEQEQGTVAELKEELLRANNLVKENAKIRNEVCDLHAQVSMWRQQLLDSEAGAQALREQLERARELCRDVDRSYQEKARCASNMRCQLEEAQERGSALCDDTRRVLEAVRRWSCSSRQIKREQEKKIKEQEDIIKSLQQRLEEKCSSFELPSCSTVCIHTPTVSALDALRRASRERVCAGGGGADATCNPCEAGLRAVASLARGRSSAGRGSAADTCSACAPAAPVPPERKRDRRVHEGSQRDACAQRPARAHARVAACSRSGSDDSHPSPRSPRSPRSGRNPVRVIGIPRVHDCLHRDAVDANISSPQRKNVRKRIDKEASRLTSCVRECEGMKKGRASDVNSSLSSILPKRKKERRGHRDSSAHRRDSSSRRASRAHANVAAGTPTECDECPPHCVRDPEIRHVRLLGSPFRRPRDLSPTSELEIRMRHLDDALSSSQRRWTRMRSASQTR